jgi:hypothetical protein
VTRFVEEAIARAGLTPVLEARRSGDLETVRASVTTWGAADLLALGAVADSIRVDDVGEVVRIHERTRVAADAGDASSTDVAWVETSPDASELDFLRAVAIARIAARKSARIGVDWGQRGMELAQVALGFGASDLRGPITRKSGLIILEGEKLKLKGQGMVELRSIKKQEIGALVTHAGRLPVFVDEESQRGRDANDSSPSQSSPSQQEEVAGV